MQAFHPRPPVTFLMSPDRMTVVLFRGGKPSDYHGLPKQTTVCFAGDWGRLPNNLTWYNDLYEADLATLRAQLTSQGFAEGNPNELLEDGAYEAGYYLGALCYEDLFFQDRVVAAYGLTNYLLLAGLEEGLFTKFELATASNKP